MFTLTPHRHRSHSASSSSLSSILPLYSPSRSVALQSFLSETPRGYFLLSDVIRSIASRLDQVIDPLSLLVITVLTLSSISPTSVPVILYPISLPHVTSTLHVIRILLSSLSTSSSRPKSSLIILSLFPHPLSHIIQYNNITLPLIIFSILSLLSSILSLFSTNI